MESENSEDLKNHLLFRTIAMCLFIVAAITILIPEANHYNYRFWPIIGLILASVVPFGIFSLIFFSKSTPSTRNVIGMSLILVLLIFTVGPEFHPSKSNTTFEYVILVIHLLCTLSASIIAFIFPIYTKKQLMELMEQKRIMENYNAKGRVTVRNAMWQGKTCNSCYKYGYCKHSGDFMSIGGVCYDYKEKLT